MASMAMIPRVKTGAKKAFEALQWPSAANQKSQNLGSKCRTWDALQLLANVVSQLTHLAAHIADEHAQDGALAGRASSPIWC